jgi:hypothetical protein
MSKEKRGRGGPVLAIHERPGSFSDQWIACCEEKGIPCRRVDCYSGGILSRLEGTDGLMWHWQLIDEKAVLFARQLAAALDTAGIPMFPDFRTSWHYDDKLGQKYLFEAIGAPLVPVHVFYDRAAALEWAGRAGYPKVFKLRSGAASVNVRLVSSARQAKALIRRAFGRGIPLYHRPGYVKDRLRAFRGGPSGKSLLLLLKSLVRLFVPTKLERQGGRHRGYVYFQDFIPGLDCDYRIVIVGEKGFAMRRLVRTGDFRASGSEKKSFDPSDFDRRLIPCAFETAERLGLQSAAFDMVMQGGEAKIIEVSYAFATRSFPGYWTRGGEWVAGDISPQEEMLKQFIEEIENAQAAT